MYEPFVVKVDHVSAYFLDGPFAWPNNEDLVAAAAAAAEAAPPEEAFAGAVHQQQQQHTAGASVLQGLLARHARVVSLLDRFGLGMDLHVATSVHPRSVGWQCLGQHAVLRSSVHKERGGGGCSKQRGATCQDKAVASGVSQQ